MSAWKSDDEHYPSQYGLVKRPGLGSHPTMDFSADGDDRVQFDITTRSDQSRRHQPEPGKIIMADGRAVFPEELKKLPCLNKPTCQSQRKHSLQSRQQNLCDVCKRKQRYCQSGTARTRRTEKRREARLEQQKQLTSKLSVTGNDSFPTPHAISSGRIIQATKRSSWRKPFLQNIEASIILYSQL